MNFLLSIASKFVSRRQALRWALNYNLSLLTKARTEAEWAGRLKDVQAVHASLGVIITAFADGKVDKKEQRLIEESADATFHELFSG